MRRPKGGPRLSAPVDLILGRTLRLLLCAAPMLQAQVPKAWDDKMLAGWALPVAGIGVRPGHFSEQDYYRAPVAELVRTYPVYHPDREPSGYWESLRKRGPQPLLGPVIPRTDIEWVAAGRRIFEELDVPAFRSKKPNLLAQVRSREEFARFKVPVRPDGTVFSLRWVRTAGGVELSINDCATCHTCLMPDGKLLHGAPFNESFSFFTGPVVSEGNPRIFPGDTQATINYRSFGVPWVKPDLHESLKTMSEADLFELFVSNIPGTFARSNGSPFYITKVPDLIGFRDRKYIDHTGTHRHRGIGDLMRYAALVGCCDPLDFGPHRMLADAQRRIVYRFPDQMLYALAQYIYSLPPPPNPHRDDPKVAAGKAVFEREGCPACHAPPLYTNNRLTPAKGFRPPQEHLKTFDILDVSAGTDPSLALKTRKGTGYYKVPSLKGVWYRGLYLHDGSVATLEDLFDPNRLRDGYAPSGFKGYKVKQRAVPGHEFGLKLKVDDKAALLAFLRSI